MMNWLRKYQLHIFIFTITTFLAGTFIGFGAYFFSGQTSGDAVVEVNGEKIPARIFHSHYRRARQQMQAKSIDDAAKNQLRDEIIRDLVQSMVFAKEAKRYGIYVPDQEVAITLTQVPAFQEQGRFNPQLYIQALQSQIRMSPQDFEEEQRKSMAFFKLRWLIQSTIKVTDQEAAMITAYKNAGKPFKTAVDKKTFEQNLWHEKVLFLMNQWYGQINRTLKVEPHYQILEGTL